ncbi:hypothetical protein ACHAXA_009963 [Cyclostephanos tholiformis]|uniref:EF-hand domain-containing protein n=1 Tax=Cyclostephanos tholiformis TaxID=382380 RepID=A0ABD3RNW3_9STRA
MASNNLPLNTVRAGKKKIFGRRKYYTSNGVERYRPANNSDMLHPKRRRRQPQRHRPLRAAAGIFLLSRLVATAITTISSDDDNSDDGLIREEMCDDPAGLEPPRVCNVCFFGEPGAPMKFFPSQRCDNSHLGDGIRSAESSGVFFDSLDRDGDGAIEPEEVALFLRNEIGGKQFDTPTEVDEEVGTIMARLDLDNNDGLEMSDMIAHWNKLESLLTAEEVADWIVYSVQLPMSVGNLFLENGITGYDFLEIVENKGRVLLDELGIEKESFRNKIVRRMQARMLGIGSSPETPQNFTYKLEGCKAVTLSWEISNARVFPIHSYRVQRRGVYLIGPGSSKVSSAVSISNGFDSSSGNTISDWKTVYVGGDNEFVDMGLETGHNYKYRVQAWNSVGKSGWETIDLSQALKKQRCSTKPSQPKLVSVVREIQAHVEIEPHWEWASTPKRTAWGIIASFQFIYQFFNFFFAMFAMLAGVMRYRRATATSTTSARVILPAPWLWKGVNRISTKFVGQEIIPRSMLGDPEALMRESQLHDQKMGTTGLRGYDRSRKNAYVCEENKETNCSDRVGRPFRQWSLSANDLQYTTVKSAPPIEVLIQAESKRPPSKFSWQKQKSRCSNISAVSEASAESEELAVCGLANSVASTSSTSKQNLESPLRRRTSLISYGRVCSECMKKFKVGKRYKHHCARCMATFCHKHGRSTHSNFTSCKIPGDCICNSCLSSEKLSC